MWTSRSVWGTKENCYFGLQVFVPNPILFAHPPPHSFSCQGDIFGFFSSESYIFSTFKFAAVVDDEDLTAI